MSATDSWAVSAFSAKCQQWLSVCCKQCFPGTTQTPGSSDCNGKTQLTSMDSGFHLVPLYFKTQKLPEAYSPFEINNSKNKQTKKQTIKKNILQPTGKLINVRLR